MKPGSETNPFADEGDSGTPASSAEVVLDPASASARDFFDVHWRLIHATAGKAGLTDAEAGEVVEEVMIAVARKMPGFTYEPGKESRKDWLFRLTRWKINDQHRKRLRTLSQAGSLGTLSLPLPPTGGSAGSPPSGPGILPIATGSELERFWEEEWHEHVRQTALAKVKPRVATAHFEMYHLHAVKGLPVKDTAKLLNVSKAAVCLASYRIGRLVKAEMKKLAQ